MGPTSDLPASCALIRAPGDSDEPSSLRTSALGYPCFCLENPPSCAPDLCLSSTTWRHQISPLSYPSFTSLSDHSCQHTNMLLFLLFLPPVTVHFSILCSKTPKRRCHSLAPFPFPFSLIHTHQAFILFIPVSCSCQGHE